METSLSFEILVVEDNQSFGVLATREGTLAGQGVFECKYFYLADETGLPPPQVVLDTIGVPERLTARAALKRLMDQIRKHAKLIGKKGKHNVQRPIPKGLDFGGIVDDVFEREPKTLNVSEFRKFFVNAPTFKSQVLGKLSHQNRVVAHAREFRFCLRDNPVLKTILDDFAKRAGTPHQRVQEALRHGALDGLASCLHGGAYSELDLVECRGLAGNPREVGDAAAQSVNTVRSSGSEPRLVPFPFKTLLSPSCSYLVCGPPGSGKTTLLRHLQCGILDQAGWLAIYCEASRLCSLRFLTWDAVLSLLAEELSDAVDEATARGVLAEAAADWHLVLLVDRLESASGRLDAGTKSLRELHKLTAHVRVIVAARDEEVQWVAHSDAFALLRLLPFKPTTSQDFFQDRYPGAQVLVGMNSDLLTHPMYAYLVRELLQVGQGEPVSGRGALYSRIIDYWLLGHNRDDVRALKPSQIGQALRELGRIAWEGLRKEQPLIERMPFSFWTARASIGNMELLKDRGLIDLVHSAKTSVGHDLVFSHRSFQEWHAAQWAWQKSEWRGLVRDEYWNPQWHDLIRFLASERGDDVINELYPGSDSDDALYSRLFLAAECVGEGRASSALARRIESDLKVTTTKLAFRRLSIPALVRMGTVEAREYVWNLLMQTSTRLNTLFLLTTDDLRRLYTPDHLSWALRNRKGDGACLADDALTCWAAHIPQKALSRLVRQLHIGNELERLRVAEICVAAASRLEATDIEWLRRAKSCGTPRLRAAHAKAVEMLQGYLTPDDTVRLGLRVHRKISQGV